MTLAVFLMLGGTASAADITNPLWRWNGGRWVSECQDKALCRETCDLTELLAASRAWAKMMSPGTWRKENDGALHQTWAFVDFRGDAQSAEQRWRKAVEACGP